MFQDYSNFFSVNSVNNPRINLVISVSALVANVLALACTMHRAKNRTSILTYMKSSAAPATSSKQWPSRSSRRQFIKQPMVRARD